MDNSLAHLKIPPHSAEAESAFLSAVMERNSLIDDVDGIVAASDFYRHENQTLFARMSAMAFQNRPIDPVTLCSAINEANESETVSSDYIIELATTGRGASNALHYARIIRDRSIDRQLIRKGYEIADIGYSEGEALDKLDKAQALIMESSAESPEDIPDINTGLKELVERIDYSFRNQNQPQGLTTGFSDLDAILLGLQGGDLVILGARPAQGKTALAMNIAEHAVTQLKTATIVFSLEMSRAQLLARMASSVGRINLKKMRTGAMVDEDWPKLAAAMSRLKDAPLYISDRAATTTEQLISRSRKIQKRTGKKIGLIVADYLQIFKDKGDGTERISRITGNLKTLAREMDCPVIALSQLSRECEKRTNKRPTAADLRDGGSIEADADVVALLYRDEVYDEHSPDKGIAEVIIAKHRAGETGTVRLASNLQFSRFDNLDASRMMESAQRQQSRPAKQTGGFSYADR